VSSTLSTITAAEPLYTLHVGTLDVLLVIICSHKRSTRTQGDVPLSRQDDMKSHLSQ